MKKIILSVLMVMLVASFVFAEGQGEKPYPSKDIRFITSGGAGGGTDTICRKLGSIVEKQNDLTMPVVNKPGKGEAEAPYAVMTAKADGYTIGNVTYGGVVNAVYNGLIPQYKTDKLKFVAVVTQEADALMVNSNSKWNTFEEFIADAKANPGEITIGITYNGGRPSMITKMMEEAYGVEFHKVNYVDGAGPQREAVLSGEADAVITSLGDFSAVLKSGQVKGLLEFSMTQNVTYPDVPPLTSIGRDDLEMGSFIAIVVPQDTPQDVVDKIEEMYYEAQHSDEFRNWTASVGVTATWIGQDKATQFIENVQKVNFKALDDMKAAGLL